MSNDINRAGEQFGDYRVLRLLGIGGFGQVYLGEHKYDRTLAAIKILYAQLTKSEELKEFLNEARTFRLQHPNIVRLLDFGIGANDTPYLAMEYAPYGTLRARHPRGSRIPLQQVYSYIMPIADALQYAHDHHLIHRDVKPENMLLGPQQQIWLSDFGIMTAAHNTHSMPTAATAGTWSYIAPEQIRGRPQPASDQYALGVVIYEWLCGEKPFTGTIVEIAAQHIQTPPNPLRTHIPELSAEIEAVVLTALEKDPRNRFATIRDFANAFQQVCQRSAHLPADFPVQYPMTGFSMSLAPDHLAFTNYPSPTQQTLSPLAPKEQPHTSHQVLPRRSLLGGFIGLVAAGTGLSYLLYSAHKKSGSAPVPQKPASVQPPTPTPAPTSPPPVHQTIVDPLNDWSFVYSHTDHLEFDRTHVADLGGDPVRIMRSGGFALNEEIVWKLPGITSFSAVTYFWLGEAISPFSVYTSLDGTNWTQANPGIDLLQLGNFKSGTWSVYQYTLSNLSNVNYVKMRWNNTSGKSWSPEIGNVTLKS
ncbi:MAG TPA: serine/threonine-protein kinase [Ktedonobacteraceae bacterium]|jgi:serine/threonine protein kinase